jgi:hypothetical protein
MTYGDAEVIFMRQVKSGPYVAMLRDGFDWRVVNFERLECIGPYCDVEAAYNAFEMTCEEAELAG